MQIKNVYVEQFGKLREKEITFKPGINIIYGQNESGKSTLEHFILTMLYGHRTSRKYGIDPRGKYIPFGKDFAYGHLSFITDNETIVIERKIGQKRKDDFFRSFEKMTYDQTSFDEHLGKDLFDLDLEPFLKTLFIDQNGMQFHPERDENLNTKLTNLLETGDEDISFTKAMDTLDKEMKAIKAPRKAGELDNVYEQLSGLYERLDRAKVRREYLYQIKKDLTQRRQACEENEKKQNTLKRLNDKIHLYDVREEVFRLYDRLATIEKIKAGRQMSSGVAKNDQLVSLNHQVEALEKEREAIQEVVDELHKTHRQLQGLVLELEAYLGYEELPEQAAITLVSIQGEENLILEKLKRFEDKTFSHPGLLEKQEELGKLLHQYEIHLKKLRPSKHGGPLLSLLTAIIISFYGLISKAPLYLVLGGVGVVLAFLLPRGVEQRSRTRHLIKAEKIEEKISSLAQMLEMNPLDVIKSKKLIDALPKKKEKVVLENQLEELQKRKQSYFKATNTRSLEAFIEGERLYRTLITKKIDLTRQKNDLEKEQDQLVKKEDQIWESLEKDLTLLGYEGDRDQVSSFLDVWENKIKREDSLLAQEETVNTTLIHLIGDISQEAFREEIEAMDELGIKERSDGVKRAEKEKELREEATWLNEEIIRLTQEEINNQGEEPLLVEDEISTLLEKESQLERRFLVLETTKDLMKTSYEELRREFIIELNQKVSTIFQAITKSSRQIKVTEHFSMKYEEDRRVQVEDFLSKGTLDQLYLALRLAMVDLIFKGETVPIFMDEPFVRYDGERLKNVLNYLKENEEKYQLFIFTCHEREMTTLEDFGHVIYLD